MIVDKYSTLLFFIFFLSCFQVQDHNVYQDVKSPDFYDFYYSHLTVDVSLSDQHIKGHNKMFFASQVDLDIVVIDLFANLNIDSILLDGDKVTFLREYDQCLIPCDILKGEEFIVDVFYQGKPVSSKNPPWEGGFVWAKDMNDLDWVGVACQKDGGKLWWPVKNALSDEPDSIRINIGVEKPYFAVSNGQLINVRSSDKKRYFEWLVTNPINNYNVTLNIADYQNFTDTFQGISGVLNLDYYVLEYNLNLAKEHFMQVKPMLNAFEKLFGPYPFYSDGYKLVESSYLGMEHQSCISYGNQYLKGYLGAFPDNIDFDFIIIHETAHEWWGNSVSMKDQKDMWIHESFATYAEALYVEEIYGYEQMLVYLNYQKNKIINKDPIFNKTHTTTDMYYKGSWMLHTLRTIIQNDTLWHQILKGIQVHFKHQTVSTIDVINYIEKHTELDLASFFDQYLFSHKLPVFEYFFETTNHQTFLHFKWDAVSANFDMPLLAKINSKNYSWIYPTSEWQKLDLVDIKIVDFKIQDRLFLIEISKVK